MSAKGPFSVHSVNKQKEKELAMTSQNHIPETPLKRFNARADAWLEARSPKLAAAMRWFVAHKVAIGVIVLTIVAIASWILN